MFKHIKIILMILSVIFITSCSHKENKEVLEKKYIPVETSFSKKITISNQITVNGKVYPCKEVMILPKIVGKVVNINVEVGDNIKKGDILFEQDKSDIKKQVTKAKTALNTASTNLSKATEQVENAKQTLKRSKELYEEGALSKSQYEQTELLASDNNIKTVQASVDQARAVYEQALDTLKKVTVKAPIDGKIAGINVEVGEYATTAQPAMTIVDDKSVFVQIDVTEDIVNQMYKDKEILLTIKAASIKNFKAKIFSISPAPDKRTQLYPVKIQLDNKESKMRVGMFVSVMLNIDVKEGVIAVPSEVVVKESDRDVVYTIVDNKAKLNEVELGLDNGVNVEIKSGLKIDEQIIVKGQNFVQDGSIIKVVRGDE
ncbi:efflux RND transporter periplasmic adaptor subunit [Clostridiaceae bacterium M8S5]|nr:efflux RND transporter periplasmic adaptor subunit [Clostridiaceae bacterium M8S5]